MELHIYTAQIGKYKGPDAYDITVKSGDHTFAPTWEIVRAWKQGVIDWDTYSEKYRQLMLESYKQKHKTWDEILRKGVLTLLCYCRAGENCHRYLLADFLIKLGEKERVQVINEGERTTPEKEEHIHSYQKGGGELLRNFSRAYSKHIHFSYCLL